MHDLRTKVKDRVSNLGAPEAESAVLRIQKIEHVIVQATMKGPPRRQGACEESRAANTGNDRPRTEETADAKTVSVWPQEL